jgi:Amidohydrolase family
MEATADGLDVPNPWSAPSAALINSADLDNPVDPSAGGAPFLASIPAERRKPVRDCAWHKEALDARLYQLGAKFLAGSTATDYGIMPGSGLHLELTLLHRIGLSPREAIAAATSNFADIYGWRDVGRIESGRVADVLILDADPRSDLDALDHIDMMVFRGDAFNRKLLLEAREAK